ncbi:YciI family protein [Actinomadura sp. 9N407]|uniref:YciI family protein n=1 Tax=Actinomadura sp. 9N407 TaxID=3375154 RepID=UPI00378DF696
MKYVLMFIVTEQYNKELAAKNEEELQAAYEEVAQWFAAHAAAITHHAHLQPAHTATTLRQEGGESIVTDGPFIEGKEVVAGYAEVEVPDLDAALAIARDWPACPIVEVRPIM